MVGAGQVKHLARHPAAQRHAQHGEHDHGAHPHANLFGRKILAHHQRIRRDDAALEQAEHGRDDVQRHQAVKGQKQQQRRALQRRAQHQRADAANAVRQRAGDQAADDAAGQHDGQHLRTLRRAKTQVGAIGHDMHLRHGHGHAAGQAGHAQRGCGDIGR